MYFLFHKSKKGETNVYAQSMQDGRLSDDQFYF